MKAKTQIMTDKTCDVLVSQQIKNTLPGALIDYLLSLIQTDREKAGEKHVFMLNKNKLGSKELQDIVYIEENKLPALHRVFGCDPINGEIVVACDGVGYYMKMAYEG